ncbi:unnamed protein product [Schistocephalus solidus]|uniref:Uncharacterized protein n=1 Tax=Schistocephalus solidus TaxID=70667 RepID=A0A3P7CJU6_SCHSO|nr:unnamed protein product [Schistocephalus solidus]
MRVKRPFSEPPVECFNTVPYKKRCQWYPEVKKVKCFRYVGSTTLDEGGLDALQDMGAVGARRIFWTSTSTACVINPEDEKKIDYQVHLSAAKRRLSPSPSSSPKRRSRSPLEVIATLPTESGPSSSKCLRVIDLESCSSSAPATDPLAITMNGLRLVATPVEPPKVESEVLTMASDNNFVYDVYRIDPGARTQYPNSAEGSDLERSPHHWVLPGDHTPGNRHYWRARPGEGLRCCVCLHTRTNGHLLNSLRMQASTRVSTGRVHDLNFAEDCALNTVTEEDMQRSMDLFAAGCSTP